MERDETDRTADALRATEGILASLRLEHGALRATIEARTAERDALREALQRIERHGPIMGSTGSYRQGQLDILESSKGIARAALNQTNTEK